MSLGTFDRTPPPFFRQGPSALTKLAFFSALALFLMVADTRFEFAKPLRAAVATALLPVQRVLNVPVQLWQGGAGYLGGLSGALASEKTAQEKLALQAEKASRADRLERENEDLRSLLGLRRGAAGAKHPCRGAVRGRRPVLAQAVHRPRRDPRRRAGRAGARPGRRARPGDAECSR